ncbi:hypothetical protein Salat_0144400 [Sesamum alatum]|uniref:Uncharacterized protein n=1 Tax=Sesamum alatum TaxID=300844 RepID=A0AAE1YYH7_9LAMI|nr:hypothetical protein Salat_0144400 [Sesamum alatum]
MSKEKRLLQCPVEVQGKCFPDIGKNMNVDEALESPDGVERPNKTTGEPSKMEEMANARKQFGRVAKNYGKLDLNVEFSNGVEEPAPRMNQGSGSGRAEDDNIEGGDDKVVKAA